MLSDLLKNEGKRIEKYNFYIKYFNKMKCYADRPYLVFLELKPETHIYIFLALLLLLIQVWDLTFFLGVFEIISMIP